MWFANGLVCHTHNGRRPATASSSASDKEPHVVMKVLRRTNPDASEFRMSRIDQPVRFRRGQDRWNDQHRGLAIRHEGIADGGQLARGRTPPPIGGQPAKDHLLPGDTIRYVRGNHHQVPGRIATIDVHVVLDHGQRQVFGRIRKPRPRTGPAAAKPERSLSVERLLRVKLPKYSIDARQLMPPYAIRPSTFSTARAPGSVSISSRGTLPPSARLGRFSQRAALSLSPM